MPRPGALLSWHRHVFISLEASWILQFGDFMEALSGRHNWSWTLLSAFAPPFSLLQRMRVGWKFQASTHGLVFPVTSLHPRVIQKPSQSHLITTKDTPITQEIARLSGALFQEPQSKTYITTRDASSALNHLENYKNFRSSVPGTERRDQYILFY